MVRDPYIGRYGFRHRNTNVVISDVRSQVNPDDREMMTNVNLKIVELLEILM
jgi:hypothetical protein